MKPVPSTADKERYDGDQWRYALNYFGSDQDLPSRQGECEDVVLAKAAEALVQGQWTMTHSSEVANVNQKPGPTDMSAGVMAHKKESDVSVRLAQRAKEHSWYSVHVNVQSHP